MKQPSVSVPHTRIPDTTNVHLLWEPTVRYWLEEMVGSGLEARDVRVSADQGLAKYLKDKKERMKRRKEEIGV